MNKGDVSILCKQIKYDLTWTYFIICCTFSCKKRGKIADSERTFTHLFLPFDHHFERRTIMKLKRMTHKDFAGMFVRTRSGEEAALRLGVEPDEAKSAAARLLEQKDVRDRIRELDSQDPQTLTYVKTGLSRLAFGPVNDAVLLVFKEEVSPADIMSADLFNVSEIKRVKGGGVEIKFFDRQKALEKLVELDPELGEVSAAEEFLKAVRGREDEGQ